MKTCEEEQKEVNEGAKKRNIRTCCLPEVFVCPRVDGNDQVDEKDEQRDHTDCVLKTSPERHQLSDIQRPKNGTFTKDLWTRNRQV